MLRVLMSNGTEKDTRQCKRFCSAQYEFDTAIIERLCGQPTREKMNDLAKVRTEFIQCIRNCNNGIPYSGCIAINGTE